MLSVQGNLSFPLLDSRCISLIWWLKDSKSPHSVGLKFENKQMLCLYRVFHT